MVDAARRRRLHARDPLVIVNLARTHTINAVKTMVALMMDKEQAGTVRLRAAEILIERGYGKSPVALYISANDGDKAGVHGQSILDRVQGILAAREMDGDTIDLEASQMQTAEPVEDLVG